MKIKTQLTNLALIGCTLTSVAMPVFMVTPRAIATVSIFCDVINIKTGQLALRYSPNGKSRAGLDNGNTVKYLRKSNEPWVYVRVINGPNSAVNGLEGWVNSDYLSCYAG